MSLWSIVLITTGVVCITISLVNARRPPTSTDVLAVHKGMEDERIRSQLKRGPLRVDAKLGIQFGSAFVVMGLLWQILLSVYWL